MYIYRCMYILCVYVLISSALTRRHLYNSFAQERYVSEAYSEEPVDVDQVKKLTEFGDDYRNYIDSHSDCASVSLTRRFKSIRCGRYHHGFRVSECPRATS